MSLFSALRDGYYNRNRTRSRKARHGLGHSWSCPSRVARTKASTLIEALETRQLLSAVVATDFDDYAPGSVAIFTALNNELTDRANFDFANETIEFRVTRRDTNPDFPDGNIPIRVQDNVAGFPKQLHESGEYFIAPDLDSTLGVAQTNWDVEWQYADSPLLLTARGVNAQGQYTEAEATKEFTDTSSQITQIAFSSSPSDFTVGVSNPSTSPLQVETRNVSGTDEKVTNGSVSITVTSNSSTGRFDINSSGSFTATSLVFTMSSQESLTPQFFYRDTTAGTPILTAKVTNRTGQVPLALLNQTSTLTRNVAKANTTTSIARTTGIATTIYGDSVTFQATVAHATAGGAGAPTGQVEFLDGTTVVHTTSLSTLSPYTATFTTSTLAAGSHSISARYVGDNNFNTSSSGNVSQSVNKAMPTFSGLSASQTVTYGTSSINVSGTLSAPTAKPAGQQVSITIGTASATATVQADGTFSTTINTSTIAASTTAYAIAYSYAGDTNFASASNNLTTLTVLKANQTITFNVLADKTYGDAAFTITATASSNLPVSFAVVSGPASIFGNTVTISGAETVTIRASQAGNTNYNGAPDVDRSFIVNTKQITGSFTSSNKTYDGTTDATISSRSLAGVVGTDDVGLSGGSASFANKNVGNGNTVTGTGFSLTGTKASNYSLASSIPTTSADITPKAASVTPNAASKTYGDADPTLSGTLSGFLAADNVAANYSRTTGKTVGSYTISAMLSPAGVLGNYDITYNTADFSITARSITVTAEGKSKTYGAADPALTYQITSGNLVNGDSFSGALTRVAGENVGTYAINQDTLALGGNYTLTYVGANLTITPATLTVTADPQTKVYGAALPALIYSYAGLVSGDTASVITGGLTTTATAASGVGTYPITPSSLSAGANYTIAFTPSTLTVTPAPLTFTADSKAKTYGEADPALTYTTTGLVNGDSVGVVSGVILATATGAASTAGTHTITATGGSAANYTVSHVSGTLTVAQRALIITANNRSKIYGDTLALGTTAFATNATAPNTGLAYSDTVTAVTLSSAGAAATATVTAPGPNYDVIASNATGMGLDNYAITYQPGTLTVNRAALTVSSTGVSKIYGTAIALTGTAAGIKDSDAITYAFASASDAATAGVGIYAIGATLSDPDGKIGNYDVSFSLGNVTVNAKALTITADSTTKTYGDAVVFAGTEFTTLGLVNSDTVTAVTLTSAGAAAAANVATYAITPGAAVGTGLSNYTIGYVDGSLTVNKATLTVTADDKSRTYGDVNPAFTASYSGFQNDETLATSGVTGMPSLTPAATAASPVGSYTIRAASDTPAAMGTMA